MSEISRHAFLTLSASAAVLATRLAYAQAAMTSKLIPKSGETLPVIGLGTSQVFREIGQGEAASDKRAVVRTLIDGGGTLIDTAPSYGDAENVTG